MHQSPSRWSQGPGGGCVPLLQLVQYYWCFKTTTTSQRWHESHFFFSDGGNWWTAERRNQIKITCFYFHDNPGEGPENRRGRLRHSEYWEMQVPPSMWLQIVMNINKSLINSFADCPRKRKWILLQGEHHKAVLSLWWISGVLFGKPAMPSNVGILLNV